MGSVWFIGFMILFVALALGYIGDRLREMCTSLRNINEWPKK